VRVSWHPGAENLGDYITRHHAAKHHIQVRPVYTHQTDSKRHMPRAQTPSALRGCVNPARGTRQSHMPVPRVRPQHTTQDTCHPAHNPVSYQSLLSNHKLVRT
jgi:hypothetical protein